MRYYRNIVFTEQCCSQGVSGESSLRADFGGRYDGGYIYDRDPASTIVLISPFIHIISAFLTAIRSRRVVIATTTHLSCQLLPTPYRRESAKMVYYYTQSTFQAGQIVGVILGILFWVHFFPFPFPFLEGPPTNTITQIFIAVLICYCCCCKNNRKTQRVKPGTVSQSTYRPALYNLREVEEGNQQRPTRFATGHTPRLYNNQHQNAEMNARLDGVSDRETDSWGYGVAGSTVNEGRIGSNEAGILNGSSTEPVGSVAQPPPAYHRYA